MRPSEKQTPINSLSINAIGSVYSNREDFARYAEKRPKKQLSALLWLNITSTNVKCPQIAATLPLGLNRSIGEEYNRYTLESFGLIAKEGRKYGLTCLLSTQRPRDIPEDVLSQVGMFIVHRLINDRDRQMVEKACGSLDVSAASFLPTLMEGEAIVVGIDSPMPMPLLINRPLAEPQSKGPDYDLGWV